MSGGAPGPRSFVAGHSGVVSSVLTCHELAAHDVCVAGYSFPNACRDKPSQAKVLTGDGYLREAQVDVPLSVSHSCV